MYYVIVTGTHPVAHGPFSFKRAAMEKEQLDYFDINCVITKIVVGEDGKKV